MKPSQRHSRSASIPARGRTHALWPPLLLLCAVAVVACRMATSIDRSVATRHVFRSQMIQADVSQQLLDRVQNNSFQPRSSCSYMLYVTSDTYACASLVLINQLRNTLKSSRDIDITILHTDAVSSSYIAKWRNSSNFGEGVHAVQVAPIQASSGDPTWRHSLTKLRIFQHIGYDRVVFLDADSLPIRNLDHLFDLPVYQDGEVSGDEDADVETKKNRVAPLFYAPKAYWLPQPFFASTVMVLTPNNATFDNLLTFVNERRHTRSSGDFDMDVLNAYFHKSLAQLDSALRTPKEQPRAKLLPGTYVILNSDFRRPGTDKLDVLGGITVNDLREQAQVVHYSCLPDGRYGKPWGITSEREQIKISQRDDMKTRFHPFFLDLFERFWSGSNEWCNSRN
ncbi:Glucose n-acetyltransferase 1, partial [Globisporangium splendens]